MSGNINYWHLSCKVHKDFFKRIKYVIKMYINKERLDLLINLFYKSDYYFIIERYPKILNKPFRKYLYCSINKKLKFYYIFSHYNFLSKNFPREIVMDIYTKNYNLLDFRLDIGNIKILLCYIPNLDKEGEIVLLMKLNDKEIYSLTFLFFEQNGSKGIFIGGIQGRNYIDTKTIKLITKKMFGLRPVNFLLFVIKNIADNFNISEILAVKTKEHIANCSNVKKTGKFLANYDQYWLGDFGRECKYWYNIPIGYKKKKIEDIPSKKRNMYKKRYEMLDSFSKEILKKLKS